MCCIADNLFRWLRSTLHRYMFTTLHTHTQTHNFLTYSYFFSSSFQWNLFCCFLSLSLSINFIHFLYESLEYMWCLVYNASLHFSVPSQTIFFFKQPKCSFHCCCIIRLIRNRLQINSRVYLLLPLICTVYE